MKLFIPGPVDVRADVLQVMSKQMMSHRSEDISILQNSITSKLKRVMGTSNDIVISSSSGTGSMEMALKSLTLKKALVISNGAFGDRFFEIAKFNQIDADYHRFEDGKAIDPDILESLLKTHQYDTLTITHNETSTGVMNDLNELDVVLKKFPDVLVILDTVSSLGGTSIQIDQYHIDVCVSASQKALGLPPGLSFISLSKEAIKRLEDVPSRGYYLNLKRVYDLAQKKNQYPSTPTISIMYALDYQLDYIIEKEGLINRYQRHLELAKFTRAWAKKHFDLLVEEGYQSNTLTTVINCHNYNMTYLKDELKKSGYIFSEGYGKLKSHTFRIAHMGDRTLDELKEYLKRIEEIWQLS
ncbi:MAG TPA: aminotransferase [Acholeplasmataceae bacterium]|nr:aminotransferase [Acholeplasmataceae bacterium]